jgi:hypothetical protein
MEGDLLRNVYCILIDNREHSYEALEAKLHEQYNKLPDTEQWIEEEKMKQYLIDNADQLLLLREHIYDFGVMIK